jgi:hypothetical protein
MKWSHNSPLPIVAAVLAVAFLPLCCNRIFTPPPATKKMPVTTVVTAQTKPASTLPAETPTEGSPWPPAGAKVSRLAPNIYLGIAGERRWVEVHAKVCLERGYLEHLLSRDEASKHHESVLSASFDAFFLDGALKAAGAKPGKPVQFFNKEGKPDFKPPSGDKIKITLRYKNKDGKEVQVPAQRWVRNTKTKKELDLDWVFAGSTFFLDPDGKPTVYGANDGRVITTSNFISSLLDLPVMSAEGDPQEGLEWEANTELIPPRETPVIVVLEVKK